MNNYCPYDGGICYSSGCYFLSTPPICSKQATKSIPSKEQLKSESKEEDKIFIDGDFNNSYEARVKKATGKNMILSKEEYNKMQEEITRLKAELERKNDAFRDGWIAKHKSLTEELERERELRKELVKVMNEIAGRSKGIIRQIAKRSLQSLIEKAKDL